jgi:hypothetical protein
MEYATRGRFGGLGHKTTGGRFSGLGLKTRTEIPRRNGAAHGGITEVMSRRSKFVQEAWPSDQQKKSWTITLSGQWFGSKYLGAKLKLYNSPDK